MIEPKHPEMILVKKKEKKERGILYHVDFDISYDNCVTIK